jgi:alkylation response protein AidB-like acyl-CoA dehydrogenase
MDFELSADQEALRDAARDLLAGQASPTRVRAVVDGELPVDADLWAAMVEQGWTALAVPETLGGLGFGPVELVVLLEQVGAHTAPAPFLQQAVAADALGRGVSAGVAEARGWLDAVVAAERIATVAWKPVTARSSGDGWVLDGTPEPAIAAPLADVAVVVGETGDGPALFALELTDATRPKPEPAMDRTRTLGWLHLDTAPAVRLGGGEAVVAFSDLGAAAHSAEMLGGAARVLDLSVEYAKERQQFGQPIGSFQAVKHRCADMLVDVEGMRSAAYYAGWAIGAQDPDASVAASTAKAWCSDASKRVLASGLQIHGGIGFTWEHDLHLFLKRGQLDQISFGDAAHHRARLAGLLRARVEAGLPVL